MKQRIEATTNNIYGGYNEVKKSFPWGFFYRYYEMRQGGITYFERRNRIDALFDWICVILSQFKEKDK